jgi:hypothetical protein
MTIQLLLLLMHHQPCAGTGRIELLVHRHALGNRHLPKTFPSTRATTTASACYTTWTRFAESTSSGDCARAGLLLDDEGTLQALYHAVLDELLVEGGCCRWSDGDGHE